MTVPSDMLKLVMRRPAAGKEKREKDGKEGYT